MSLFELQRVRTPWQRALGLLATVALVLLTVQSVRGDGFDVNFAIPMVDVSDEFCLIGDGAIVTSNGAGPGVGFQDIITDLTESDFWDIDVGVKTSTWDYRHIVFDDVTKFDNVKIFQVVLRATHKKGPHTGVEQLAVRTHSEVKSDPPRSKNDTNYYLTGNSTHKRNTRGPP